MSFPADEVRIRRMGAADLERVMEIAKSLPQAPRWPISVYIAAMDAERKPRRIALVAELVGAAEEAAECAEPGGADGEQTAGAKAPFDFAAVSARLKSCPDTSRPFRGVFRQAVKPDPVTKPGGASTGKSFPAGSCAARTHESTRVVGFLVARLVPPEAELETIAVASEAQRRGIANLILKALMLELTAKQVTKLTLEVRASNQAALRLYQAQGFEQTGRRSRYYADPEEDAVILALGLT